MAEYLHPVASVFYGFTDHSNEKSGFSVDLAPMATEDDMAARVTGLDVLGAAVDALTLCNRTTMIVNAVMKTNALGAPANKWAQREMALQVGYHDTVNGYKMRISIPGVDWDSLAGEGDFVDADNLAWIAFKTAFELAARSPLGNTIAIDYGKLVGRRS